MEVIHLEDWNRFWGAGCGYSAHIHTHRNCIVLFRVWSYQAKCTYYKLIKSLLSTSEQIMKEIQSVSDLLGYISSYLYSHSRPTYAINYHGLRCYPKRNSCSSSTAKNWPIKLKYWGLQVFVKSGIHLGRQNIHEKPKKICLGKRNCSCQQLPMVTHKQTRNSKDLELELFVTFGEMVCEWKNAFNSKTESLFSQPYLWCCFWLPGLLASLTSLFNRFDLCDNLHLSEEWNDYQCLISC